MGGRGSGGTNRLPDEAKARKGTLVKARQNPSAPRVEIEPVPDPPEGMPADERQVWLDWRADVDQIGTYSASNRQTFRQLVRQAVRLERLEREDPTNHKAIETARTTLFRIACSFGLTPADRSRINVGPAPKKASAFQELMGGFKN